MDALKFIEADVQRGARHRGAKVFGVGVLALIGTAVFGLVSRRDLDDVFAMSNIVPHLLSAFILAMGLALLFRFQFSSRNLLKFAWIGFLFASLLACHRYFFPLESETIYDSTEMLYIQSFHCFLLGASVAIVSMAVFLILAFRFSSLPTRRWRVLLSFGTGAIATVMLAFHCDSNSGEHLILGHLLPAVVIAAAMFGLSEILFRQSIRSSGVGRSENFKNINRMG